MLAALPIVSVMALYPHDVLVLLNTNAKFMQAAVLVPYFVFGTMFLCLTDYTTLQYHLANKTWITFIVKLMSGISNVLLTLYLVPIFGLKGVGIAMLTSNFLFFFLSMIIRLPGLSMKFPRRQFICIMASIIPVALMYKFWLVKSNAITAGWQMILLLIGYYIFYTLLHKISKPDNVEN